MFNMERIGRKISELRREQNMTQLELADKLGISYQAVSNWERGSSMPDIAKLPELAEIFGVTIDELLGEKAGLINSVAENQVEAYVEQNTVTVEELKEVEPLLKPKQVEEIADNMVQKKEFLDIRDLEEIAPFMSKSTVNELARKCIASSQWKQIECIAPFMSRDAVDEIAQKLVEEGKSIEGLMPFISGPVRNHLFQDAYEKKGVQGVDDYLPFMSRERLQEIAAHEYEKNGLRHIEALAPFLDRKYLTGLAREAIEKEGIKAIAPIAPFLDRQLLDEYVSKWVQGLE